MSAAPDPAKEKLLRELDEQAKSLKEYLASHPSKEGAADLDTDSRTGSRFSAGWCFGVTIFHFVATFALAGISFITGMGSFTQDVSSEASFWRSIQWLWTPLAMAAWDPLNVHNDGQLIGLAFLWSCCIGIVAGFVGSLFPRWSREPHSPPQSRSDNFHNA